MGVGERPSRQVENTLSPHGGFFYRLQSQLRLTTISANAIMTSLQQTTRRTA